MVMDRPRPKPKPRNLEPRDPAILAKRPQLSYDPSQLTWNRQNMFTKKDSRNLEQKYCYCGEHKPNEPTVMCAECNHWFHISCCDQVRCLRPSCSHCCCCCCCCCRCCCCWRWCL